MFKKYFNLKIKVIFVCAVATLGGCASYLAQNEKTKNFVRNGQITSALEELKILSEKEGRDQLVHMLNYASVLQINGDYKQSAIMFNRADQLTDSNDYHSVTNVVASTLGSEEMIQYKGESYEKFLINSMNAINYLMLGDYDAALVECRKINNKISSFKTEGREPYEFSSFARYLSAVIWESQKNYDDAYIEYEGAYKLDPSIPTIKEDLIRISKLAQRYESLAKWKKEFSYDKEALLAEKTDNSLGELIVIHQQGFGARKVARRDQPRFPTLLPENQQTQKIKISFFKASHLKQDFIVRDSIESKIIYDVDKISQQTLNKDYNSLIARRLGGMAAKAVVASQIGQKNEALGQIAWIAMNLSDRADLRQWSTLPAKIQMARVFLKPGQYQIKIQGIDYSGSSTADLLSSQVLVVRSGKKTFVNYRSLR
ncbi:MAG: COG3014 family protein [Pseudobdellovibrio sp.]